ncbi:Thioredoxin 3-2 [Spatholobus suberectus]|nr:Thioredoxin 3-2 [Spatholobus suberectus]
MSQHLRILRPPPLFSMTPTAEQDSLSLCCFSLGFRFGSHSSVSPLISVSCGCAHQTPPVRLSQQGSLHEEKPVSLYLQPISSETHFDRVLAEAQTLDDAVVVVWMANWCRKCIYLKPKLEKLAADYYPRLQFYSVDVNTVSHKLVAQCWRDCEFLIASPLCSFFFICYLSVMYAKYIENCLLSHLQLINLWKDSKKQAEVIGGHKAYLVINEVQEMIENECTTSFSAAD